MSTSHLKKTEETEVKNENVKFKPRTNKMKQLMKLLGIELGDFVEVNGVLLVCNDKYDLIYVNGGYSSNVPNLVLGMVSGKHKYKVCKVTDVTVYQ